MENLILESAEVSVRSPGGQKFKEREGEVIRSGELFEAIIIGFGVLTKKYGTIYLKLRESTDIIQNE